MNTIESIRAYVATAHRRSLTQAARDLNVSPSVITKRVRELEDAIGRSLFTRTTRSVVPSASAQQFADHAARLLASFDALVSEGKSDQSRQLEGKLRVKIPRALGIIRLREVFIRFSAEHPGVDLDIDLLDQQINPVEEGYDLAIGVMEAPPGGVVEEPICDLQFVLCASPDYLARRGTPKHPYELDHHDCLVFFPSRQEWRFTGNETIVLPVARPRCNCNDLTMLLQTAIDGNGIAQLPDYVAQDALADGRLVRVLKEWRIPAPKLSSVIPKHRVGNATVRALLAMIIEEMNLRGNPR